MATTAASAVSSICGHLRQLATRIPIFSSLLFAALHWLYPTLVSLQLGPALTVSPAFGYFDLRSSHPIDPSKRLTGFALALEACAKVHRSPGARALQIALGSLWRSYRPFLPRLGYFRFCPCGTLLLTPTSGVTCASSLPLALTVSPTLSAFWTAESAQPTTSLIWARSCGALLAPNALFFGITPVLNLLLALHGRVRAAHY